MNSFESFIKNTCGDRLLAEAIIVGYHACFESADESRVLDTSSITADNAGELAASITKAGELAKQSSEAEKTAEDAKSLDEKAEAEKRLAEIDSQRAANAKTMEANLDDIATGDNTQQA